MVETYSIDNSMTIPSPGIPTGIGSSIPGSRNLNIILICEAIPALLQFPPTFWQPLVLHLHPYFFNERWSTMLRGHQRIPDHWTTTTIRQEWLITLPRITRLASHDLATRKLLTNSQWISSDLSPHLSIGGLCAAVCGVAKLELRRPCFEFRQQVGGNSLRMS